MERLVTPDLGFHTELREGVQGSVETDKTFYQAGEEKGSASRETPFIESNLDFFAADERHSVL